MWPTWLGQRPQVMNMRRASARAREKDHTHQRKVASYDSDIMGRK